MFFFLDSAFALDAAQSVIIGEVQGNGIKKVNSFIIQVSTAVHQGGMSATLFSFLPRFTLFPTK